MADEFDKDKGQWLPDDESDDQADDNLDFDWLKGTDDLPPMQNKATKRLGFTGDLSWRQDDAPEESGSTDESGDAFDWSIFDQPGVKSQADSPQGGMTGELPWMRQLENQPDDEPDDDSESFEEQVRRAEQAAGINADETPDWLRGTNDAALPPLEDQELDDETFNTAWFASLEENLEQAATEDAQDQPSTPVANDELPDWLTLMSDADEQDQREADFFEQAAAETPLPDDDWLSGFEALPDENDEVLSESTKVEKPDWLIGLEAARKREEEEAALAASAPPAASDDDLLQALTGEADDLFAELDFDDSADSGDFAALFDEVNNKPDTSFELERLDEDAPLIEDWDEEPSEPVAADDADWLQTIGSIETSAELTEETDTIDELDSFLASISVDETPPAAAEYDTGRVDDFDALFEDERLASIDPAAKPEPVREETRPERPEWIKNLRVEEVTAAAMVRKQQDRPLEELSPDLLALREASHSIPASGEEAVTAAVVTPLISSTASQTLRLSEVQKTNARRLASLAGGGIDEEGPRRYFTAPRIPLDRLLVAAILIAALLLPYYVSELRIGDAPPQTFDAASPQMAVFNAVDTLSRGDRVLLAAEYSGTGTGELDDLTRVIMAHLAARGANIALVSTNPTGYLHGSRLAQSAVDGFQSYFIPNSTSGLRNFAQSYTETLDARLDNFALIIVLAETSDTVRAWAEQVEPVTRAPIAYITSAAAAPFALPYAQNAGAFGALSGYRDAYTYAAMLESNGAVVPLIRVTTPPEAESTQATTEPTATPTPTPSPAATRESTATQEGGVPPVVITESPTATADATAEPTNTPDVAITATPTSTPPASATPTLQPTSAVERFGIVSAQQAVNVRGGPGTGFEVVGLLQPQERVRILDENADGTWYEIEFGDNEETGWIAAFLLTVEIMPGGGASLPPASVQYVGLMSDINQAASTPAPEGDLSSAPYLIQDADARWYSMTLGLIAAIAVIVLGNLLALLRRNRKR